jgi:DNA-binding phage protein
MDLSETDKKFDVADYLNDLDDVAGYVEIALEDSAEDTPWSTILGVTNALDLGFEPHTVAS